MSAYLPSRDGVPPDSRRIIVVGPCASGKSSLVAALRSRGYDAHVCGQEHSAVRGLWRRSDPDVLVALEVDLPTLRQRRSPAWPEAIYDAQRERLREAFEAADLRVDTTRHDLGGVVERVTAFLLTTRPHPS